MGIGIHICYSPRAITDSLALLAVLSVRSMAASFAAIICLCSTRNSSRIREYIEFEPLRDLPDLLGGSSQNATQSTNFIKRISDRISRTRRTPSCTSRSMLSYPCENILCPSFLFRCYELPAPCQSRRIVLYESFFNDHSFTSIANSRILRGRPSGAIITEFKVITPIHFRVRSSCSTIISCSGTYSPCAPSGRLIAIRL
ncbi:hypothetical protein BN140_3061 [Methanoculleus bourgensis MS2]|uniref:Uncharacterized protein n=1 Tax=Methanoculleus bourgensis (strain ATCC 43281 / DSM 3045 / OCM 15 / MS2) TaxID=1201294 RepID=W6PQK1_METBM|nr:hypothetical protein BN140_3061 [Methanoculleus bourgensis MS2]